MEKICIGLVGAGYGAYLHGNGYEKVSNIPVMLKTVMDIDLAKAEAVKKRYNFAQATTSFEEILADPEINVLDIVTPPCLHVEMIKKGLAAGKHIICEKPLTGYFGLPGDPEPIGEKVSKAKMYDHVINEMESLREIIAQSGKKFLYAENYVYSTPVQKAAEIISKRKSKILLLKGEESLKGSSSAVAGSWRHTGGGSLIRVGSHPVSGVLWLKQVEAKARGEVITVTAVTADTAKTTACLSSHEHRHITARPQDVEDFSNITITFSDNTKAIVIAADTVLGGTKNYIEIYGNDTALICNITPTDILNTYFLDDEGMENVHISEMLPQAIGWNKAFVSDEIIRGFTGELQDFMETIYHDREPISNFDLAYQTIQVIYAAYLSAEEGRKVSL